MTTQPPNSTARRRRLLLVPLAIVSLLAFVAGAAVAGGSDERDSVQRFGAAWAAVLLPPLLRSRVDSRPNSSVTDFRKQLATLQRTVPARGAAPMRSMARPLAPSPRIGLPVQRSHGHHREHDCPGDRAHRHDRGNARSGNRVGARCRAHDATSGPCAAAPLARARSQT